jgi:hypothetical protein
MGLRYLELESMILPIISIDEFEPKTGSTEEVIVVAFFAKDELPAYDLDDFIDKGIIDFLDSEVSPNPNEQGQYLIFIEFKRQPNFWNKLFALVKDIENVTGKVDWKVQPYLVDRLYKLNDVELQQVVVTKEEDYVARSEYEATVEDYVHDSDLLTFEHKDNSITVGGRYGNLLLEFVDFGDTEAVSKKLRLDDKHINLETSATTTALRSMFGKQWDVTSIDKYYFLTKTNSNRSLVVTQNGA